MLRPTLLKIENIISFKKAEFTFYEGQAVIVVGDNRDNPSQRGNGSGKSALLETLALAFTGSSVRDVKVRELINNEAEYGQVDLYLIDDSKTLHIQRRIFASSSKSAEYNAWINSVDQKDHYADFNQFNTWVFEQLGISKEDFFNFYLLTQSTYKPFLNVGDVGKKEIINRFSGADKIDDVFPLIETDSKKIGAEISSLENQLTVNNTKQQVYAEQLSELRNEVSNETKAEKKAEKEQVLEQLRERKNTLKTAFNELKEKLAENLEAQDKFEYTKDYDTEIEKLQSLLATAQKKLRQGKEDLTKVKDKFAAKIQELDDEEKELTAELVDAKQSLKELNETEAALNKQLLESIECPNCHHKFSLRDKEFDYDQVHKKIDEALEEIAGYRELIELVTARLNTSLHEQRQVINTEITKAQEKVQKTVSELISSIADTNKQIKELETNRDLETLSYEGLEQNQVVLEKRMSDQEQLIISNEKRIDNILAELHEIETAAIDDEKETQLEAQIKELVKQEEVIKNKIELKTKEKAETDAWEIHFKQFKSHLANKSIKNIQDYTNLFLESMGTDLSINIDGYRTIGKNKLKEQITTTVLRDGFDAGSFGKFSGGERGRINISVILGMQELINLNSPTGGLDLLICDEILDQVDSLGLEHIVLALQGLGKTIMIVSQNEINALNEYTITVRKENKISTII